MKKTYLLQDLECAHCAAKMEQAVAAIDGVIDASVSFMASTITIDAPDNLFDDILKKAKKVISKIEPDCTISL